MTDILVVDDNADIRRLFRATLARDFDMREADSGAQALQLIEALRPKVVFLDVMMPGDLNGLQVLSAIRENPAIRKTVVIMVTARGQEEDFKNANRHGADGYIVKPFSTLEVLSWAKRHIDKENEAPTQHQPLAP